MQLSLRSHADRTAAAHACHSHADPIRQRSDDQTGLAALVLISVVELGVVLPQHNVALGPRGGVVVRPELLLPPEVRGPGDALLAHLVHEVAGVHVRRDQGPQLLPVDARQRGRRQVCQFREVAVADVAVLVEGLGRWGETELEGGRHEDRAGAGGLSIGGGGVDRAPWLAPPPPPPKRCSIDGTPKILPRLTPGPRR